MKHFIKMAFYLLSIISIFGISSCERELYENQIAEGKERITIKTLEDLPFLKNSINSKISNKSTTNKEIDYFQLIDESKIVVIEDENNLKTYTLPLKLEMTDELINLIAKETSDELKYYLVKYTSTNFDEWIYNLRNNIFTTIETEQTIIDFEDESRCFGSVEFFLCPSTQHFTISGNTDGCVHSIDKWMPILSMSIQVCGDNSAASSNSGSGTSGTPVILTSPTPCNVCPVNEEDENNPCDKIKKLKDNLPTFNEEISNLASRTNLTVEDGLYKVTNSNVIQNPGISNEGSVSFAIPQGNGKYVFMGHTHNSPSSATYSVPSYVDLEGLAYLMNLDKVEEENFVCFLFTADGTYYALTFESTENFKTFFATVFDSNFNQEIADKKVKLMDEYYNISNDINIIPLIKENSTDNLQDKKNFLKLLQNNNLGVKLLESTDSENYTEISYNETTDQIISIPCP